MAENLIIPRKQSALVMAGRQQVVSPQGDLWTMLPDYVTDEERFQMGSDYNSKEEQIDEVIDSGGTVKITLHDGTLQAIGKAPLRPHPPTS